MRHQSYLVTPQALLGVATTSFTVTSTDEATDALTYLWVYNSETDLKRYIENAVEVDPDRPVLVDKYMDRADELDVDALCDQEGNVTICGIMQHIEQAGVHSGTLPLLLLLLLLQWPQQHTMNALKLVLSHVMYG